MKMTVILSDFFGVNECGLYLKNHSFLSLDLPDTQRNDAENFRIFL